MTYQDLYAESSCLALPRISGTIRTLGKTRHFAHSSDINGTRYLDNHDNTIIDEQPSSSSTAAPRLASSIFCSSAPWRPVNGQHSRVFPRVATMSLQTTPADNTSGKILLLLPVKPINAFTERVAEKWPHFQVEWISTRLPDGGKLNLEDLPQETWEGVRILATFDLPRHPIPGLRYVQLASSGSNQCEGNILFADPNILFCTANGVHP